MPIGWFAFNWSLPKLLPACISNNTPFYLLFDRSSGQCKCLFQGVARADVLATGTRPPASSTARASSTALAPAPAPAAASTTTKLASTTQAQVTQTTTKQTTTTSFTKTTSTTTATPLPPSVSNVGGRSAPAPSSSNSTAISVSNPVFSGTAQPITSSVVVSVYYAPDSSPSSQTLLGTCTSTAGTGAFSFTAPSLSDGTYFFTVSSPAGSNAYKIVIDTVTPPAPVLSSINGQNPSSFTGSSTSLLTFEGTARPGDTVHVLANNDTVGSNVTDSNSRFLVTSDSLDDGKYVYSVRAQSYSGAESTPVFANNGQNVTIAKPTAAASQGCLLMNESFTGTSVIGSSWIALNNACLTGTNGSIIPAGSGNNIPGCPSSAPIAPAGYLQLTSAYNWQSGAILINDEIRGGDGFEVTMDMLQYGGSGADGIAFFLVNGDANLTKAGGFGGSLGYAQYNGGGGVQAGVSGGYVGVGFDAWGGLFRSEKRDDGRSRARLNLSLSLLPPSKIGNYARDTEGRGAATAGGNCSTYSPYTFNTSSTPNAITVRGPGQDMKGYCWLASAVLPSSGTGARSIRAGSLANALRTMRLTVSPTDSMGNATVKVEVDYKDGVGWRTELSMPAPKPVPDSYKLGVTSGTGAANDYHLIRNLIVKSRKAC